jgi:hypothetical protein
MTMPVRFALARGTAVAGVLRGQRSLLHQGGAVDVTGRLQGRIGGVHPCCVECRERPCGRLKWTIRLISIASPTVVVSAMAHSTAATAKGKKRQCADTKCQPNPIADKPVHCCVPSVSGAVFMPGRPGIIRVLENLPCVADVNDGFILWLLLNAGTPPRS